MTQEELLNILSQNHWFCERDQNLKDWLVENGKIKGFAPGSPLFLRGDDESGVYALLQGAVRVTGSSEEGSEAILTLLDPGTWFGEASLFDMRERTHDVIAENEVLVLHIEQNVLERFLSNYPAHWRCFGILLATKLRLAFSALEDLALLPAKVRLAHRLAQIASAYGERSDSDLLPVTVPQEVLGRMLSISRQTTNQILKELEAASLIDCAYGRIEVKDLQALRDYR